MFKKSKVFCKLQALLTAAVLVCASFVPQMTVQAAPVEIPQAALGVDVSRYQGQINWDMVAASGIKFAMIRLGFRTQNTGMFNEDPYARYNLREANRVGIKVGAYFFSTAVNAQEAVEEATWVCNLLDPYQVTFPVVYDCEGYNSRTSRQFGLGKDVRTALATIFLDTVAARGYTPMFYSYKSAMDNNRDWDMDTLSSKYKIWVASYPKVTFPYVTCNYTGTHSMWQYTSKGAIAGIEGFVDVNVSYFDYTEIAPAKVNNPAAIAASAPVIANVYYNPVMEVVSVTSPVNMRTEASTDNPDSVVLQLRRGDLIWRVGVGNNGWSMVKLANLDKVFYVSNNYLTRVQ